MLRPLVLLGAITGTVLLTCGCTESPFVSLPPSCERSADWTSSVVVTGYWLRTGTERGVGIELSLALWEDVVLGEPDVIGGTLTLDAQDRLKIAVDDDASVIEVALPAACATDQRTLQILVEVPAIPVDDAVVEVAWM